MAFSQAQLVLDKSIHYFNGLENEPSPEKSRSPIDSNDGNTPARSNPGSSRSDPTTLE